MAEALEPARSRQRASNVIPFPLPQLVWGQGSIDFDPDHFTDNWLSICRNRRDNPREGQGQNCSLPSSGWATERLRDLIDDLGHLEQKLLSVAEFARAASAHCQTALAVKQH